MLQQSQMNQFNNNIQSQLPNELNNLKNNPIAYLAKRNLKLPDNFQGGPKEIVQYWLNNGTMDQGTFNRLQAFVGQIKPFS